MAQADCLPSAMRALFTGANQQSSTAQNVLSEPNLRRPYVTRSLAAASHAAARLA
jgi:hypothetical protein